MREALATDTASVQLTLSLFMAGFAIGQLIFGPLSDRKGRRPVLIGALVLYAAGSTVATVAPTIGIMLAGRMLQAIGAAGPLVLTRSVVRDLYHGTHAAIELGRMGLIVGVVPSMAPLVGGFLAAVGGWRAPFASMLVFAAMALFVALVLLPETLKAPITEPFSPRAILKDFAIVLRNRSYRFAVAQMTIGFCGIFSFISGSSFILQGSYGLGEVAYGISFGCGAGCAMAGNLFGQRMIGRMGPARLFRFGTRMMALGGVGMLAAIHLVPLFLGRHSALEVVVPYMVYSFGMGPLFALTMMRALQPFPDRAGAASSLLGFIQQMTASAVGAGVGVVLGFRPDALVLALILAAIGVAAIVLDRMATRPSGDQVAPPKN
jgi:DHA1 family bicyclomycin/chloramphenicol resistance-like MFS transporter